jgi:hypothetical protein
MTKAVALMQAAVLTPTTSNSKDDSNSMTAYNNRNASNSRTTNTVGTPTTAGMIAKVIEQATACREDNNKHH